jgi:formate dehydrogenase
VALALQELAETKEVTPMAHVLCVLHDDPVDGYVEKELATADIVISQPFWPAYLTAERIAKAPNLKL